MSAFFARSFFENLSHMKFLINHLPLIAVGISLAIALYLLSRSFKETRSKLDALSDEFNRTQTAQLPSLTPLPPTKRPLLPPRTSHPIPDEYTDDEDVLDDEDEEEDDAPPAPAADAK